MHNTKILMSSFLYRDLFLQVFNGLYLPLHAALRCRPFTRGDRRRNGRRDDRSDRLRKRSPRVRCILYVMLVFYDDTPWKLIASFKRMSNRFHFWTIILPTGCCQALQTDRRHCDDKLSSQCRLSVCKCCALWRSESVQRVKSCTVMFLAGNFLLPSSDAFAVGCIVQPQNVAKKNEPPKLLHSMEYRMQS